MGMFKNKKSCQVEVIVVPSEDGSTAHVHSAAILQRHRAALGLDKLDLVKGHCINEFLTKTGYAELQRQANAAMREAKYGTGVAKSKTFTTHVELMPGQTLGLRAEIRAVKDHTDYLIVASTVDRTLWDDVVSGPVWVTTQDGAVEVSNQQARELQGQDPTGLNLKDFDKWSLGMQTKAVTRGVVHDLPLEKTMEEAVRTGQTQLQAVLDVKDGDGKPIAVVADVSTIYEGWPAKGGNLEAMLVDSSASIVLGTDREGKVDGYNEAAFDFLQVDLECGVVGIAGETLDKFGGSPEVRAWLKEAQKKAIQGQSVNYEIGTLQSADVTSHVKTNIVVHPRFDNGGQICGVVLEAQDITERLMQLDMVDRMLKAPGLKPAWAVDLKGNVIECNSSATIALNATEDEVLGRSFTDFVMKASHEDVRRGMMAAKMGRKFSANAKLKRATSEGDSETTLEMMLDLCPRWDHQGILRGVLVTADLPSALRLNGDGVVIEINEAACNLLNIDDVEILGEDLMPYVEPDRSVEVFGLITGALQDDRSDGTNTRFMRRKGNTDEYEPFSCAMDASPFTLEEAAGGGTGCLVMLQEQVRRDLFKLGFGKHGGRNKKTADELELVEAGDHVGHQWDHAKIEGVRLKKAAVGGAWKDRFDTGAREQAMLKEGTRSPDDAKDPMEAAWDQLVDPEMQCINLASFKKYLITTGTNTDKRLVALRHVNAMFEKKVLAALQDMSGDTSNIVDKQHFMDWWARSHKASPVKR